MSKAILKRLRGMTYPELPHVGRCISAEGIIRTELKKKMQFREGRTSRRCKGCMKLEAENIKSFDVSKVCLMLSRVSVHR